MNPRIFALCALALLVPNIAQAPHACSPAAAAEPAKAEQMEHISILAMGTKGPPAILIPGLATPRAVWDGVAPDLAKSHRVYLVQVNGFGGDAPGANLGQGLLDGAVADLDRYIGAHKLQDAAVVGHSMGGLIGLMLAKAHPDDLRKLMMVDALPYVGDTFLPGATVAQVEPQAAMIRDRTAASYGTPMSDQNAAATAEGMALKPAARTAIAGWVKAADPRVTAQALYEDMTTDLRPAMSGIATPVTLIYPWGGNLAKDRADTFYRRVFGKPPHLSFVDIGDSGHFVMLDQPEAFAAALTAFLGD